MGKSKQESRGKSPLEQWDDEPYYKLAPGVVAKAGTIFCKGVEVGPRHGGHPHVSLIVGEEHADISLSAGDRDACLFVKKGDAALMQTRRFDGPDGEGWALEYGFQGDTGSRVSTDRIEDTVVRLDAEVARLREELADVRGYIPMLARMAFAEQWTGASIPLLILQAEGHTHLADRDQNDRPRSGWIPTELVPAEDEPLPVAAQAVRDAYNARFQAECRGVGA